AASLGMTECKRHPDRSNREAVEQRRDLLVARLVAADPSTSAAPAAALRSGTGAQPSLGMTVCRRHPARSNREAVAQWRDLLVARLVAADPSTSAAPAAALRGGTRAPPSLGITVCRRHPDRSNREAVAQCRDLLVVSLVA